jgi:hypothetical protein
MAVEIAESVHTTTKYHHFDLSRADGIFDGSQVRKILKTFNSVNSTQSLMLLSTDIFSNMRMTTVCT